MNNRISNNEQLRSLTSLRFFAAAAVLIAHTYPRNPNEPVGFVQLGSGVTFFFILSGFILTYTYLNSFRELKVKEIWNFYLARGARIWPVHVLTLAAVIPFYFSDLRAGKFGNPIFNVASTAALFQTFVVDGKDRVLNAPSWSLSAEFFFYVCFPFLIWCLASRSIIRRAFALFFALTPWLLALLLKANIFAINTSFLLNDFYFLPPVRICDFLAGIMLGFYWHRGQQNGLATSKISILQSTSIEIGAVLVLVGWAAVWTHVAPTPKQSFVVNWSGAYTLPFLLLIWVFGVGRGWLSKLLAIRPLVYLGEISFSVYMLHLPVMICLSSCELGRRFLAWGLETMNWPGTTLVISTTTILASAICYHLYEMPLRDWLRRKLSIRKTVAPAVGEVDRVNTDRLVRHAA